MFITYKSLTGEVLSVDGNKRANIKCGLKVMVVQKQDQRTGKLTEGTVERILTNSAVHPHGIKVRLTSGIVGRVKTICKWQFMKLHIRFGEVIAQSNSKWLLAALIVQHSNDVMIEHATVEELHVYFDLCQALEFCNYIVFFLCCIFQIV